MASEMSARDVKAWEAVVDRLKALRTAAAAAEAALLRECLRVEIEHEKMWRQLYRTFDECLDDLHICKSTRYRNFVAADAAIGAARVDVVGIYSSLEAMKIADPARREKFLAAGEQRVREDGVPWSQEAAETARKTVAGTVPADLNLNKRIDREVSLHAENVALKRELHELKRQLREKDEEIAKLSAKVKASGRQRQAPSQQRA